MSASMAEVLAAHQISRWLYCDCGAYLGDYAGPQELFAHQAEVLAANGYGKLEQAWDEGCRAMHYRVPSGFKGLCEIPTNPYRRPE